MKTIIKNTFMNATTKISPIFFYITYTLYNFFMIGLLFYSIRKFFGINNFWFFFLLIPIFSLVDFITHIPFSNLLFTYIIYKATNWNLWVIILFCCWKEILMISFFAICFLFEKINLLLGKIKNNNNNNK